MTHDAPPSGLPSAIAAVVVYPLIGPGALVLTMAVPLAVIGLFVLGPGGLLYYFLLAGWWLPGLYALFAPPFLLTGILVALAGWIGGRFSLLAAVAATEVAFLAYFAFWYLLPGGIGIFFFDYANLWGSFSRNPWTGIFVLPGTVASWYVLRRLRHGAARPPTASIGEKAVLVGIAAIAAAGLGYVLTAHTRIPAVAWKDCLGGDFRDAIRGCTAIVDAGADQPVERRVTAYLRRGSAHENNRDFKRAVADYSEAIRLDPSNAGAHVRRALAYASLGDDDRVIADADTALRLDRA
jgi:tetratricopeptide (TPR) repeat protein